MIRLQFDNHYEINVEKQQIAWVRSAEALMTFLDDKSSDVRMEAIRAIYDTIALDGLAGKKPLGIFLLEKDWQKLSTSDTRTALMP